MRKGLRILILSMFCFAALNEFIFGDRSLGVEIIQLVLLIMILFHLERDKVTFKTLSRGVLRGVIAGAPVKAGDVVVYEQDGTVYPIGRAMPSDGGINVE